MGSYILNVSSVYLGWYILVGGSALGIGIGGTVTGMGWLALDLLRFSILGTIGGWIEDWVSDINGSDMR